MFKDVVEKSNFKPIEGWPSVYIKGTSIRNVEVLTAYVDDVGMLGGKEMDEDIKKLSKMIDIDEPTDVDKYLGCKYRFDEEWSSGAKVTHVAFDATDYLKDAVEAFKMQTGITNFKSVDTPFVPEQTAEQLNKEFNTPGEYGKVASSL